MTNEKMNIHKALCELKILDNRIPKAIGACRFASTKKVASKMIGSETTEDFLATEKASWDKVMDLLRRREAIKRAVVLSNAVTKITVGGKSYTVAEAIELKNHGMDGKRKLHDRLAFVLNGEEALLERTNQEAERKADLYVQGLVGGKESKSEEVKTIRDGYLAGLVVELVDGVPGGAKEALKKLDDEINTFVVEVDAALSTSNALTEIEVEY